MVEIQITGDALAIEVLGIHKIWALKSRLSVPLSSIISVRRDAEFAKRPRGLRAPGTYIPRWLTAGTFYADKKRWFWDVSNPANALVIEVEGEKYQVLVLEIADAARALKRIEAARAQL